MALEAEQAAEERRAQPERPEQGHAEALHQLGLIHLTGYPVSRSWTFEKWYRTAVERNETAAEGNRQLLFPNGLEVSCVYAPGLLSGLTGQVGELVAGQLTKIGVKLNLKPVDASTGVTARTQGNFDNTTIGIQGPVRTTTTDPFSRFHSKGTEFVTGINLQLDGGSSIARGLTLG